MAVEEKAVFGGGCFWCTEAVFTMLKGVSAVMPGYATSNSKEAKEAPSYEEVSTRETNYVESVEISYDPSITTYRELLDVFFASHDPTTLNRQDNDVGLQYRSVIFYHDEGEQKEAEEYIKKCQVSGAKYQGRKIVTAVEPLVKFYPAEDYHRDYFATHKNAPYCQLIIEPKLEKIKSAFADKIQK